MNELKFPKVSLNAIITFKDHHRKGYRHSEELIEKKLQRNWLLGTTIDSEDNISTRVYKKTVMKYDCDTDTIISVYIKIYNLSYEINKQFKEYLDEVLGINELKEKCGMAGETSKGLVFVSKSAYNTYRHKTRNFDMTHLECRRMFTEIVKNSEIIRKEGEFSLIEMNMFIAKYDEPTNKIVFLQMKSREEVA